MDENLTNNVVEEVEETVACEPVEENDKPGFGEYAMLGLAGFGALCLAKKAVDLGKKGYAKGKAWIESKRAAKAGKTDATEAKDVTPEETTEE